MAIILIIRDELDSDPVGPVGNRPDYDALTDLVTQAGLGALSQCATRCVIVEGRVAADGISIAAHDRDPGGAAVPVATARYAPPASGVFKLEGEYWTIAYQSTVLRLNDTKGLRYLAYLLRHPGDTLRALDVAAAVHDGGAPAGDGHFLRDVCQPVVDRQALTQYRGRITELRQEIADASARNDLGGIAALQAELEWLLQHLKATCGLRGRIRGLPSMSERARQTVTKGIRNVVRRIGRGSPTLEKHFSQHIRTGYLCGYNPDPTQLIRWEL